MATKTSRKKKRSIKSPKKQGGLLVVEIRAAGPDGLIGSIAGSRFSYSTIDDLAAALALFSRKLAQDCLIDIFKKSGISPDILAGASPKRQNGKENDGD